MNTLTITQPALQAALLAWEQDARAGRARSHQEAATLPDSLVALETAQDLWSRLMVAKRPAIEVPASLGTPWQGGFYAGKLRIDGKLAALVVSPRAQGDITAHWGRMGTDIAGACSYGDGLANTRAMAEAGSELAQRLLQLDIGGHTDWYLPARDELELLYRAFKPGAQQNSRLSGDNPSAEPPTWPYTQALPAQTSATLFRAGGAEALDEAWYWTSTQFSAHGAWVQWFDGGFQDYGGKSYEGRARAVRRLILE